ncbi:MAG: aldo/keto reductase [Tannerella sp.]|nr:aldo/keto reductase [Tannerella sp.]
MKTIKLSNTNITGSNIIMGCMRLNSLSIPEAGRLIQTALDSGINFFDHADIYGGGECETIFAEAIQMNAQIREKMIIQSKCGICKGFYDSSKEHILRSVDKILARLKTDYLDILLIHRPDTLMEPEEVAEAFAVLLNSGKVRNFGVSNYNPMQINLLQKFVPKKLIVNQLQLSVVHTPMIDSGIAVNMHINQAVDREGSVLEFCRLNDITIQAWSPFQKGFIEGPFFDEPKYAELLKTIRGIAGKYGVSDTTVAVGWITRHPANIQVVVGTTQAQRLIDCCKGSELPLTRQEWYEIYQAAGNMLP